MSGNARSLRRELRTIETLALSIAMMSPVLAMSLYGGAPAIFVGRAAPLAFVLSGIVVGLVGTGLIYLCRYFSHAGSVYGLTGVTLGPRAGFFSGWALLGCYLIYTPASAATAGYFATLFCKDTGLWNGADYIPFTIMFLLVILVLATRDIKRVGQTLAVDRRPLARGDDRRAGRRGRQPGRRHQGASPLGRGVHAAARREHPFTRAGVDLRLHRIRRLRGRCFTR